MRPPPLHRQHVEEPHKATRPERGSGRRVRRDVISSCDKCKAIATARAVNDVLTSCTIPVYRGHDGHLHHSDCGGRITGADTRTGRYAS